MRDPKTDSRLLKSRNESIESAYCAITKRGLYLVQLRLLRLAVVIYARVAADVSLF